MVLNNSLHSCTYIIYASVPILCVDLTDRFKLKREDEQCIFSHNDNWTLILWDYHAEIVIWYGHSNGQNTSQKPLLRPLCDRCEECFIRRVWVLSCVCVWLLCAESGSDVWLTCSAAAPGFAWYYGQRRLEPRGRLTTNPGATDGRTNLRLHERLREAVKRAKAVLPISHPTQYKNVYSYKCSFIKNLCWYFVSH